jgi:hypothetical protein
MDQAQSSNLLSSLRLPGLLNQKVPSKQRIDLRIQRDQSRLDFPGSSLYGNDLSLIHCHDGTTICLSHADRTFVIMKAEDIKPVRFERPLKFELEQKEQANGSLELIGHLHDLSSGLDWQQHLWLDPREELRIYSVRFFELLFGDRQSLAGHGYRFDELAPYFEKYGFPVRGRFDLVQPNQSLKTASSFTVEDLHLSELREEDFIKYPPENRAIFRCADEWRVSLAFGYTFKRFRD